MNYQYAHNENDNLSFPEENDFHFMAFDDDECYESEEVNAHNFSSFIQTDKVNWLNINGLKPEENIISICKFLNIEDEVSKDITATNIRSKFQSYNDYLFFNIKSIIPEDKQKVEYEQISFILKSNILISIQERAGDGFDYVRNKIQEHNSHIKPEVDYLLYQLLNAIINQFYSIIDKFTNQIEFVSNFFLNQDITFDRNLQIEAYKRKIYRLKKAVLPMRDMMIFLEKDTNEIIKNENKKFFEDIKDHCHIILEEIEFQNSRLESASNLYFSLQNQKLNQIMKTLTIVTTIFIPLTFITGWYGMNFDHMPELKWLHAYRYLSLLMLSILVILLSIFKRKKWL